MGNEVSLAEQSLGGGPPPVYDSPANRRRARHASEGQNPRDNVEDQWERFATQVPPQSAPSLSPHHGPNGQRASLASEHPIPKLSATKRPITEDLSSNDSEPGGVSKKNGADCSSSNAGSTDKMPKDRRGSVPILGFVSSLLPQSFLGSNTSHSPPLSTGVLTPRSLMDEDSGRGLGLSSQIVTECAVVLTPSDDEGSGGGGDNSPPVIQSPVTPPSPDLSHLTDEEKWQIAEVMCRARQIEKDEDTRLRELENDLCSVAESASTRCSSQDVAGLESLCPLCSRNEVGVPGLDKKELKCVDCRKKTCHECGAHNSDPGVSFAEWLCKLCYKRRHFVQSSGMWFHGLRHTPNSKTISLQDILKTAPKRKLERTASYSYYEELRDNNRPIGRRPPMTKMASLPDQSHEADERLETLHRELQSKNSSNIGDNIDSDSVAVRKSSSTTSINQLQQNQQTIRPDYKEVKQMYLKDQRHSFQQNFDDNTNRQRPVHLIFDENAAHDLDEFDDDDDDHGEYFLDEDDDIEVDIPITSADDEMNATIRPDHLRDGDEEEDEDDDAYFYYQTEEDDYLYNRQRSIQPNSFGSQTKKSVAPLNYTQSYSMRNIGTNNRPSSQYNTPPNLRQGSGSKGEGGRHSPRSFHLQQGHDRNSSHEDFMCSSLSPPNSPRMRFIGHSPPLSPRSYRCSSASEIGQFSPPLSPRHPEYGSYHHDSIDQFPRVDSNSDLDEDNDDDGHHDGFFSRSKDYYTSIGSGSGSSSTTAVTTTAEDVFYKFPTTSKADDIIMMKRDLERAMDASVIDSPIDYEGDHDQTRQGWAMDVASFAAAIASDTDSLISQAMMPQTEQCVNNKSDVKTTSLSTLKHDDRSENLIYEHHIDNVEYAEEYVINPDDDEDEELILQHSYSKHQPLELAIKPTGGGTRCAPSLGEASILNSDWSPSIDLSPIEDVSPSIEHAAQLEMGFGPPKRTHASKNSILPDNNTNNTSLQNDNNAFSSIKRCNNYDNISSLLFFEKSNPGLSRNVDESEVSLDGRISRRDKMKGSGDMHETHLTQRDIDEDQNDDNLRHVTSSPLSISSSASSFSLSPGISNKNLACESNFSTTNFPQQPLSTFVKKTSPPRDDIAKIDATETASSRGQTNEFSENRIWFEKENRLIEPLIFKSRAVAVSLGNKSGASSEFHSARNENQISETTFLEAPEQHDSEPSTPESQLNNRRRLPQVPAEELLRHERSPPIRKDQLPLVKARLLEKQEACEGSSASPVKSTTSSSSHGQQSPKQSFRSDSRNSNTSISGNTPTQDQKLIKPFSKMNFRGVLVPKDVNEMKSVVLRELLLITQSRRRNLDELESIRNLERRLEEMRELEKDQMTQINAKIANIRKYNTKRILPTTTMESIYSNMDDNILYATSSNPPESIISPVVRKSFSNQPTYKVNPLGLESCRESTLSDYSTLRTTLHHQYTHPPLKVPECIYEPNMSFSTTIDSNRYISKSAEYLRRDQSANSVNTMLLLGFIDGSHLENRQIVNTQSHTFTTHQRIPSSLELQKMKQLRILELQREIEIRRLQISETLRQQSHDSCHRQFGIEVESSQSSKYIPLVTLTQGNLPLLNSGQRGSSSQGINTTSCSGDLCSTTTVFNNLSCHLSPSSSLVPESSEQQFIPALQLSPRSSYRNTQNIDPIALAAEEATARLQLYQSADKSFHSCPSRSTFLSPSHTNNNFDKINNSKHCCSHLQKYSPDFRQQLKTNTSLPPQLHLQSYKSSHSGPSTPHYSQYLPAEHSKVLRGAPATYPDENYSSTEYLSYCESHESDRYNPHVQASNYYGIHSVETQEHSSVRDSRPNSGRYYSELPPQSANSCLTSHHNPFATNVYIPARSSIIGQSFAAMSDPELIARRGRHMAVYSNQDKFIQHTLNPSYHY